MFETLTNIIPCGFAFLPTWWMSSSALMGTKQRTLQGPPSRTSAVARVHREAHFQALCGKEPGYIPSGMLAASEEASILPRLHLGC